MSLAVSRYMSHVSRCNSHVSLRHELTAALAVANISQAEKTQALIAEHVKEYQGRHSQKSALILLLYVKDHRALTFENFWQRLWRPYSSFSKSKRRSRSLSYALLILREAAAADEEEEEEEEEEEVG